MAKVSIHGSLRPRYFAATLIFENYEMKRLINFVETYEEHVFGLFQFNSLGKDDQVAWWENQECKHVLSKKEWVDEKQKQSVLACYNSSAQPLVAFRRPPLARLARLSFPVARF